MQRKLCVRKMDELGRIPLPQEARTALGIKEKQNFDVFIEADWILLKLNHDIPVCKLCGEAEMDLVEICHSLVCVDCVTKIKKV